MSTFSLSLSLSPFSFLLLLLALLPPLATASDVWSSDPTRIAAETSKEGSSSVQQLWCVAKNNAEDAALQAAIDWACGQGGADCSPIQPGGPCYDAADILSVASYVFNDYFLKSGMTPDSCDFGRSAALSSLNPSHGNCIFRSSSLAMNASFAGSTPSTFSANGLPGADMNGANTQHSWWQLSLTLALLALTIH